MFSKAIKETKSDFPAELSSLETMRSVTRQALEESRLDSGDVEKVCLALEEAVTNIIRHAYVTTSGSIQLKIITYPSRVLISLTDQGRPYFPESKRDVPLSRLVETSRKGGLGQMMIEKLMDDVQYIVGDDYNELRLTKRTPGRFSSANPLKWRAMSLRARFSMVTGLIVLLIVASSYYFIESRMITGIKGQQEDNMRALTESVASLAGRYILNGRTYVEFDELAFSLSSQMTDLARVTLVDTAGTILADSRDIKLLRKRYTPPAGVNSGIGADGETQEFKADNLKMSYLRTPIMNQGLKLGEVIIEFSSSSVDAKIAEARTETFLLIFLELLLGIAGIYFLSNYFVRPIIAITEQVERFAKGGEAGELPVEAAEEFFVISKALNEMMTSIRRDSVKRAESEKLDKEFEIAGEIQKTLMPRNIPAIPGLDLGFFYRPASHLGGDLYDVFEIGEGRYCMIVADVSGKGVPASLVMSVLRTVVRFKAPGEQSPAAILRKVEEHITLDIPEGVFVTAGLAVYDSHTREFRFVSAGHNPLIHYRSAEARFELVNPKGAPLGLSSFATDGVAAVHEEKRFVLADGDFLCVYTDGLSDLADESGARLGPEGLLGMLESVATDVQTQAASEIVDTLVEKLDSYRGTEKQDDDITVLIGKTAGPGVA